mgnify:CR=1 FL=1
MNVSSYRVMLALATMSMLVLTNEAEAQNGRAQPLPLLGTQFRMAGPGQPGFQVIRLKRNQFAVDEFRDRLADHGGFVIGTHQQAFQSAKPT